MNREESLALLKWGWDAWNAWADERITVELQEAKLGPKPVVEKKVMLQL